MFGSKKQETTNELESVKKEEIGVLEKNKNGLKDLIAPGGIDASYTNHIEISSARTRYARSVQVANLPRMCTFPCFIISYFFSNFYSIYFRHHYI